MHDSILTSIKEMLGIEEDDTNFDPEITVHINTVFTILAQLGVGPEEGFYIKDKDDIWTEFISGTEYRLNSVKTYIYLKVKLIFDPPTSSAHLDAIKNSIAELEWRLNAETDF